MNRDCFRLRVSHAAAVLLLLPCLRASAQQTAGEEIQVIKRFQPTISDAYKISEKPQVSDTSPPLPVLVYTIRSKKIETRFQTEPIRPAKMEGERLTKLYKGLVKAAIGNYTTSHAEVFLNNLRSREYSYGMYAKHHSASAELKDERFFGFSDNIVNLHGKKFLRKHTLSGNLDYTRNVVHDYGYATDVFPSAQKEDTRQRFSVFSGAAGLQSHYSDTTRLNHRFRLSAYDLAGLTDASESNVSGSAMFNGIYQKQIFGGEAAVDYYYNRTALDTSGSAIIRLEPTANFSGDKWNTSIGLRACLQVTGNVKYFYYPNIDFNYNVAEHILTPYAGVNGGLEKNSYLSVSRKNPFINEKFIRKNSDNQYHVYLGLRGSISSALSYNVRGAYNKVNDFLFFVNDYNEVMQNRFVTVYDDVTFWNINGEIQYQKLEKLRLLLAGQYYNYETAQQEKPWHMPELQLSLAGNYNLRDKIILKADIFYVGYRYALNQTAITDSLSNVEVVITGPLKLKDFVDANLGIEYRYTKKLSAFVNLNNVASQKYEKWYKYPVQGFSFLAGITYGFWK
jgi:hypothetical protein